MSQLEVLEEETLPAAIAKGGFGANVELVACDLLKDSHGKDEFASVVLFSSVKLKRNNKVETVRLVVKFNQETELIRQFVMSDFRFHNEVVMYEQILPYLEINEEIIAKYYYGFASLGEKPEADVVTLQDLHPLGFRVSTDSLFLDYEHIVVALKYLARFHAKSYAAKLKHPVEFLKITEGLVEVQWLENKVYNVNEFIKPSVERCIENMTTEHNEMLKGFFGKCCDYSYVKELLKPQEPLAVVCHGDFSKSNILFSYKNGVPVQARFVDFGMSRYSSPMVDLSYFLFLNTTSELRNQCWDEFLIIYFDELIITSNSLIKSIVSIDSLKEEMKKKALYGFVACSLLLPSLVSEPIDWEEFANFSSSEVYSYFKVKGGTAATKLLCEILKDIIHFNYKL